MNLQTILDQILTHPWVLGIFFLVTLVVNLLALRRIRKEEPHTYRNPDQS